MDGNTDTRRLYEIEQRVTHADRGGVSTGDFQRHAADDIRWLLDHLEEIRGELSDRFNIERDADVFVMIDCAKEAE